MNIPCECDQPIDQSYFKENKSILINKLYKTLFDLLYNIFIISHTIILIIITFV